MTLKDFELKDDNHFVAMEYYNLILNRTFLILLTDDYLVGIHANRLVSAEMPSDSSGESELANTIVKSMVIRGDLTNPNSYINEKYISKIDCEKLFDGSIRVKNKTNFIINRANIKNAIYNPKKKWGMGNYIHDGKVYIETIDGKKREFIILGNQSGQKIAHLIMRK